MNANVGIWGRLTRVVMFLLLLAGLLGLGLWYAPLVEHNERLRKEILRLDDQIQAEEAQARQLKSSIDALSHDPKTVERLARETLSYAKPGETVIRFDEPGTNPPPR